MYETTLDRWDRWRTTIPDDVQNNCWWTTQMKGSIPDDARHNCWWMRPMMDYQYQMIYKTRVDGRDRWKIPYQMMHDTTVNGWHQGRTTDTRRWAKQLLMDEGDEGIHTRWCTKQLLMHETNKGLPIPDNVEKQLLMDKTDEEIHIRWCTTQPLTDKTSEGLPIACDVRNNGWWTRQMKESIWDDAWNNCWWMKPR